MKKLHNQLQEIEQFIELGAISNPAVSKVDTYWQLDHALRVINGIPQALENSNPKEYQPKFTFMKWMIMTFKKIPRGKGRSPKHVLPEENITKIELTERLGKAMEGLKSIDSLDAQCHFKHPLFGDLNVKQSKKFLWIHTEHHLKIVRDIVKK
ncbi:MAG: DUF1569 domain-containing protein [Nonlabens sp.]|uniref:DUF1569 domain-containing protein n=1 Tax=Nonlabens sp. TaxID=1888209 RepID=UPI003EF46C04